MVNSPQTFDKGRIFYLWLHVDRLCAYQECGILDLNTVQSTGPNIIFVQDCSRTKEGPMGNVPYIVLR